MSQAPITIIGAGLGGLTLARCLSQRGIPAVLYDKASNTPRYGYGITLHASTYRPLLQALKMDESTFKRHVAVDAASGGSGIINTSRLICPDQIGKDSFRAHRGRLESLLREGLAVRWEHEVQKLEHLDATNIIHFRNGHRVEQSCVICADGVHASTRKSLLPSRELNILPFVTFNGKRRISKDMFDKLYAPEMKDSNIIETKKNDSLLQVSLNDVAESYSISWVFSRGVRGSNDRLYLPHRPLSGATDIPEEFFEEVRALNGLDELFEDVFNVEMMKSDRILSWLMRTMELEAVDLEQLSTNGVFAIGDAAHAEPILGGEGANAAMAEAVQLADIIGKNGIEAVPEWYRSRFATWKEGIEKSKKQIEILHS